jgi:hypothetical protein
MPSELFASFGGTFVSGQVEEKACLSQKISFDLLELPLPEPAISAQPTS